MTLKLPPILEKTMRHKSLVHKDGLLLFWGTPSILDPIQMRVIRDQLFETEFGKDKADALTYQVGQLQSTMGCQITCKKYGYAQTMKNKIDLINFNIGQFEILGYGRFEKRLFKFDKNHFIYTTESVFAKEYASFFGRQKAPVDYLIAGEWAGVLSYITGKDLVCIETKCIAAGDPVCEFVIKEKSAWDKKDSSVKRCKLLFDKKFLDKINKNWKVFFMQPND